MTKTTTTAKRGPRKVEPETVDNTTNIVTVSADVQALIEQNNRLAEQNSKLMDQINQLALAVLAKKEGAKAEGSEDKPVIPVENVIGYAIAFQVTDPRSGLPRAISLPQLGAKALLRPSEFHEALEKYPHFFHKGYLSSPGHVEQNANTIPDVRKWVDSLSLDKVASTVDEITSLPTLYRVFAFIDDERFSPVDENGQPVAERDATGKIMYYKYAERNVDPKLIMIGAAVKRRIDVLNGPTSVNLDK